MKVGFITNLRAPYRTLQLNQIIKQYKINITAYYCDDKNKNRNWETGNNILFKEVDLDRFNIGNINRGILKIIKENDFIIIGGYDKPTYIILSILCKIMGKKYILLFDGISTNRICTNENNIKGIIKKYVINNSSFILGNGKVSQRYFNEVFKYPKERIYNQYLTVDIFRIDKLYKERNLLRKEYREKLNIKFDEKVLIFSGRIIDIKNIESVIKAISKSKVSDITFVITGGGPLELELKEVANKLGVKLIITGFIKNQEELFRHYFIGDALILPSIIEPWGLVINEAMACGLPVLVSEICGCSMDLVKEGENGYTFNPYIVDEITKKIEFLFLNKNIDDLGIESRKIISRWNFIESATEFYKVFNKMESK